MLRMWLAACGKCVHSAGHCRSFLSLPLPHLHNNKIKGAAVVLFFSLLLLLLLLPNINLILYTFNFILFNFNTPFGYVVFMCVCVRQLNDLAIITKFWVLSNFLLFLMKLALLSAIHNKIVLRTCAYVSNS